MKTTPGEYRNGIWRPFGKTAEVRIDLRRGWDCRLVCEHVPPRPNKGWADHGQAGDEWRLACRQDKVAVLLQLFSYIRNGERSPVGRHPLLFGAYLSLHNGREPRPEKAEPCQLLEQGWCLPDRRGAFEPDRLWGEDEVKLIEAVALQPIDEIDLTVAVQLLEPFWPKLIAEADQVS